MGGLVTLVAIFIVFGLVLGTIAFVAYRRVLRKAKGVERGLKMVPLLIHLPPPSDDTANSGGRDVREVMREKISQAQVLYDLIAGTAQGGFKSTFYGQRHLAFEIVASGGLVHYFVAVPIGMVGVVEQAIVSAYPGARLEEVEDHNIFNPQGHLTGTVGGELVLRHEAAYPIALLEQMERDPMVGLLNALSKLQLGDGAAVQIMVRPAKANWAQRSIKLVAKKRHTRGGGLGFGVTDLAKAAVKAPEQRHESAAKYEPSKLEEQMLQAIEEKTKHPGFEVLVRVLASSPSYDRSRSLLQAITTAFALFEAPGSNGFQYIDGRDMQGLVTAFIFRFFPPELTSSVLNSVELATLFHLPDAQFTPTTQVERQQSKQVDGPVNMPPSGLLMGYNFYRGVKKEIRLSENDRRRHTYVVGQTGTGKSTILENLAVQDMLAGNGFAFIDPHGDVAEKLVSMVPKERAEDVIYFNPGDMERPLGLNLFEFTDPTQKDFLIQESINMLYKLYDPGHTGIIGPRFEHWFRNAALTLMADPNGASFIEIPKVFTDSGYLKDKFKYLTDPTVIDFWTKEMGQTSDYHKSEMLGFFVSKFGAFQSNEMMRNIIGQTHSSFNLREIMDQKKILIVNLGKGQVGELNAQLLGMMFVMKFQAAAMSRSNVPEEQREDFCLYVDEFQNFSTDSFASILSEARKYRLNLIVANQFIGQLTDEIRDAVFGNVGTMMSYRCGPEDAEFLVKQFQPIFDERDLVNLPNYNAVMKLLIGGLPSQPFSITALPPLGQAHPEMGLAVKQLSAAKYGVPRQTVEADIFARLQNQPRTVVPNPATAALTPSPPPATPAMPPQPVTPPQPAASLVQPAPIPQAVVPAPPQSILQSGPPPVLPPPLPAPAPAPAADISQLLPTARPNSATAPATPTNGPAPIAQSAPVVPPTPAPAPAPATSVAPPPAAGPPPPEPPKPKPVAADELSLAQLSSTAPKPEPALVVVAPPAPQVVPVAAPAPVPPPVPPTPPVAVPKPQPAPVKLTLTNPPIPNSRRIEAHETDGIAQTPAAAPKASRASAPLSLPAPPRPKLIEAEEEDGINLPRPKPQPTVAPKPTVAVAPSMPAPNPVPKPIALPPKPAAAPAVLGPAPQSPNPMPAPAPAPPVTRPTPATNPVKAPVTVAQLVSPIAAPAVKQPQPVPVAASAPPSPPPPQPAVVSTFSPRPIAPPRPPVASPPPTQPAKLAQAPMHPKSAAQPISAPAPVPAPAPQPAPKPAPKVEVRPSSPVARPQTPKATTQAAPKVIPRAVAPPPAIPQKPVQPKVAEAPPPPPLPPPPASPSDQSDTAALRREAEETLARLQDLEAPAPQLPPTPQAAPKSFMHVSKSTAGIIKEEDRTPMDDQTHNGQPGPSQSSASEPKQHRSKVIQPLEDIPLAPARREELEAELEAEGLNLDGTPIPPKPQPGVIAPAPKPISAPIPAPSPPPVSSPPVLTPTPPAVLPPAPKPLQPPPVQPKPKPVDPPQPKPVAVAPTPPPKNPIPPKPAPKPAASYVAAAAPKPTPKPKPPILADEPSPAAPQPGPVIVPATPATPAPPKPPQQPKPPAEPRPAAPPPPPPAPPVPAFKPPEPKKPAEAEAKPAESESMPVPPPPDAAMPSLQPGEIYVDAEGNVVQG